MSLISNLNPLNLQTEKQKFCQNLNYNPQFIYNRTFTHRQLTLYGLPSSYFQKIAENYLKKNPHRPLLSNKTIFLTKTQIIQHCRQLFQQLKLPLIPIVFQKHHLTRASIKKGHLIINERAQLTPRKLNSLLAHEVQTHYLRSHNQKLQNFPKPNTSQYLRTEEGLAILNSNYYKPQPNFTGLCHQYLGVCLAQTQSFSQIFSWRMSFPCTSFSQAWNFTTRIKRGLTDTSQPGGFTKDIVYLEGLIQVIDWLSNQENSYSDLYLGKIDTSHLPEIKKQAQTHGLTYPIFMADLPAYLQFVAACKAEVESLLL